MKRIFQLLFVASLFSMSASAEYCWMVGCKNFEGFIFTQIEGDGKTKPVFKNSKFPDVGTEAIIVEIVRMSESVPDSAEDGTYILGRGSVVKVLEYIGKGKQIVRIRIVSDELKK